MHKQKLGYQNGGAHCILGNYTFVSDVKENNPYLECTDMTFSWFKIMKILVSPIDMLRTDRSFSGSLEDLERASKE